MATAARDSLSCCRYRGNYTAVVVVTDGYAIKRWIANTIIELNSHTTGIEIRGVSMVSRVLTSYPMPVYTQYSSIPAAACVAVR